MKDVIHVGLRNVAFYCLDLVFPGTTLAKAATDCSQQPGESAMKAPVSDNKFFRTTAMGLATACLLGLSACASVPNPTGEMATARAAVDNARRAGAGQLASAEMDEAQDRLTTAERAHAGKEYATARRAAEQARVAAELAEEKTRLAKARQAKAELDNTLKALRGEAAARPNRQ